jgi:hypothetical protein
LCFVRLLERTASVVISILVTLVLLELVLQLVSPGSLNNQNIRVYDAVVGNRFEKNLDTVIDTGTGPHKILTNSLGYIGNDVSVEKPEGTYRIVNVGDSYAEGVQEVDWDKNFVALLAPDLRALTGREVESLNFGFSGRGTQEAYWAYAYVARDVRPDHVILWFTIANDFANNYIPERPGASVRNTGGGVKAVLKKSALATFVFERVKGNEVALKCMRLLGLTNAVITEDSIDTPSFENQINYSTDEQLAQQQHQSYQTTKDLLKLFATAVENDGGEFTVIVIPQFTDQKTFEQLFRDRYGATTDVYDFSKAERELVAIFEELDIDHYLLRSDLRTYEVQDNSCGSLWGDHFTACGHRTASRLTASFLAPRIAGSARP